MRQLGGWLRFKGRYHYEFGCKIEALPSECAPERRYERPSPPGRSGDLTIDEGAYDSVKLTASLNLAGVADPRAINGWLSGSGDLVLSDSPDNRRKATVIDGVSYKRRRLCNGEAHDTLTVKFSCDPYLYSANPEADEIMPDLNPYEFTNRGTEEALPKIHVTGTGDVSLMVGDIMVSFTGMDGTVTIDSDAKCAFKGSVENQVAITLDDKKYPVLGLGESIIRWSGNVTGIVIEPNWRWL